MKKILVVVDMQKDFVDGALGTDEALAILPAVCDKIKNFEGDILVTYDTHFENYMETAEGKNLPVPHCIKETEGWMLDQNVQDALSEKEYTEIEKITFGSIDLPFYIEENYDTENIEIELCGLCTDICVVSNALILKANFPETKISVYEKLCAGVTPQTHQSAIDTMRMCQINII